MNKELVIKLIALYEDAIKEVKGMDEVVDMKEYLRKKNLHGGVCRAALENFDESLYSNEWVKSKRQEGDLFWCIMTSWCYTKPEIIKSLQIRVDILKTFPDLNN